jgi:hypothetical protein
MPRASLNAKTEEAMAERKGGAGRSSHSGASQSGSSEAGKSGENGRGANGEHITEPAQDAIAMLKADHRKVEKLFASYEGEKDNDRKAEIAKQICQELIVHTLLEEEIFYPAVREKADDEDKLDEAQVEHDSAKGLIAELLEGEPTDDFYDAKVKVLSEQIKHHVAEEEEPHKGIFAIAEKKKLDIKELGQELAQRKEELLKEMGAAGQRPPQTVSFTAHPRSGSQPGSSRSTTKEKMMPNQYTGGYRDRDERGRFTDDNDQRGRRGQYSQGGRYEDDDDDNRSYGGGMSGANYRDRDEEGRFTSGSRGGRYQSRSADYRNQDRDYDRDDRQRGGGQGWYGDSQGHAEAARRGWDERQYGRSDDRDDYRGGNRGSNYRDRDEEGRFTSGGRGDYRSRSADYDDDRRSSRGRGQQEHDHGGWYGDSEGHSEASRRGWQNRR